MKKQFPELDHMLRNCANVQSNKEREKHGEKSAVFLFYFQLFTKRIFYVMIKKQNKCSNNGRKENGEDLSVH